MIKINLLPRTARKTAAPDRRLLLGGAVGVLVFLGGGYAWWTVSGEAADLQRRIGATKAEIQRLDVVAKKVDQFKADRKKLEEKLQLIQRLLVSQAGPVRLLDVLNQELPEEVWLTSLTKVGTKIIIQGFAFSDFSIADFMTRLSRTAPLMTEVELSFSEKAEVQKVPLKKFEIVCKMSG
jgi:Tfp pilus assembly protein PilN